MTPQVSLTSPLLAAARRVRRRRSVLIGGHGVAEVPAAYDPENLCVAPDRFRAQVELLLGAGFEFVTVAQLTDRMNSGPPPPGLAALSFDDGMDNNHSVLLPLLREYGVPATVYVTTGLMGRPNPWLDPRAGSRMMTADELRELAAAGVEIGAHTVTHPDLSQADLETCLREMGESKATLEELLGTPVTSFAYPFFFHGPAAVEAARRLGFRAALSGRGHGGRDPLTFDRTLITGKDGVPSFLLKVAGAYEPLFASRPGRAVRALTRGLRTRLRS